MDNVKTKGRSNSIDFFVGQRIRMRRSIMGLSQESVASQLGITFQQVQKYEKGTNRVSAGRLYKLSKILKVPIAYFFEEEGEIYKVIDPSVVSIDGNIACGRNKKSEKEMLDLIRSCSDMDQDARKAVLTFIQNIKDKL